MIVCPSCESQFSVFVSAGDIAVCPTLGCAATLRIEGDEASRATAADVEGLSLADLATIKAERSRVRRPR